MNRKLLLVVFILFMIVLMEVNGSVVIKNHRGRAGTSGKYQQTSRGRRSQNLNVREMLSQMGEDLKEKVSIKEAIVD